VLEVVGSPAVPASPGVRPVLVVGWALVSQGRGYLLLGSARVMSVSVRCDREWLLLQGGGGEATATA
jgi:hypothetical protein